VTGPPRASERPSRGVLLFNLGGPETLADVRPFLYNLFSDPDIIRIKSRVLRNAVAWLIAFTRQRKSRDLYRQIGGGSPLRRITEDQARALEQRLAERGHAARVYVGMRCWKPTIDEAVSRIAGDGITRLVTLPLFPQFSVTTTGSCVNYLNQVMAGRSLPARITRTVVPPWFAAPRYIEAMADLIREAIAASSDPDPTTMHLLYSAHSIPARYVDEGDPYLEQTRKTRELIDARLGGVSRSTLAFQSKVGPVKWLEPATNQVIRELGAAGVRRVLVVPVSFVSDHIETLQEIDILYRELAQQAGIAEFTRAASLNLYPKFIDALADLVIRDLEADGRPAS
jgi:ferrochelatase